MSAFAFSIGLDRHNRDRLRDLWRWREEISRLDQKRFLKRQQETVNCEELDKATEIVRLLLSRGINVADKFEMLSELVEVFKTVIKRAEEKKANTYTLRRKLRSLQLRAANVLREMQVGRRAPEFNEQALRGVLEDYHELRRTREVSTNEKMDATATVP